MSKPSKQNVWIVTGALGIIGVSATFAAANQTNTGEPAPFGPGVTIDGVQEDSELIPLRWSPSGNVSIVTPQSVVTTMSVQSVQSVMSPVSIDSPDSPDSPNSPKSPKSPASVDSPDSPDSPDSADSPDSPDSP